MEQLNYPQLLKCIWASGFGHKYEIICPREERFFHIGKINNDKNVDIYWTFKKKKKKRIKLNDFIFFPEKETNQIFPVWLMQNYTKAELQHYIPSTVTLK